MIQEDSIRIYNQYILFKIAALPATRQDSGQFILSARLPQLAEHASFMTKIVHKVV